MLIEVVQSGFSFVHHVMGIMVSPYETYRDIEKRGRLGEIGYISVLVGLYFLFSSVVKTATFHPLLLSKYAGVLFVAALTGYTLIVCVLSCIGKFFGVGKLDRISLLWAYTLVPTVVWFFFTSLLFVVIPPPRTTQFTGIVLSIVYLLLSAMIFWWKLTLVYLTIRFGLKFDFAKIIIVVILLLPIVAVWTYLMYIFGIYKVPFI